MPETELLPSLTEHHNLFQYQWYRNRYRSLCSVFAVCGLTPLTFGRSDRDSGSVAMQRLGNCIMLFKSGSPTNNDISIERKSKRLSID